MDICVNMRQDPTSNATYKKAIKLIEDTINLNIRIVGVYNISKKEIQKLMKVADKFLDVFKGFYMYKDDKIYIVDGSEEDFQTFIHEILHSNSIFHNNNSPIWIYEGLTKAITKHIMTKNDISIQPDYYLRKEREFWIEKMKIHKNQIFQAYFTNDLRKSVRILMKILKTNKNLLQISFKEL